MGERVNHRITSPGPKKILALDGGGIRGMITVEVLAEVENVLRQKLGRGDDFRLAHLIDLFNRSVELQHRFVAMKRAELQALAGLRGQRWSAVKKHTHRRHPHPSSVVRLRGTTGNHTIAPRDRDSVRVSFTVVTFRAVLAKGLLQKSDRWRRLEDQRFLLLTRRGFVAFRQALQAVEVT